MARPVSAGAVPGLFTRSAPGTSLAGRLSQDHYRTRAVPRAWPRPARPAGPCESLPACSRMPGTSSGCSPPCPSQPRSGLVSCHGRSAAPRTCGFAGRYGDAFSGMSGKRTGILAYASWAYALAPRNPGIRPAASADSRHRTGPGKNYGPRPASCRRPDSGMSRPSPQLTISGAQDCGRSGGQPQPRGS